MITDFHAHAFPDGLAPRAIEAINGRVPPHACAVLDGTVGALLGSMDRAGIGRAVVCSIATAPKQVEPILRWSLGVAGERIVPFGSVHPACGDPAAEVRRIAAAGLRGVKLHPLYQDFAADEPRLWPLYEAVADCGLVMVVHSGRDVAFAPSDDRASPRRLIAVHEAFPGLTLVAAHMGGWRDWEDVADVLAGTDVYLDTSYALGLVPGDTLARILARHSPERILFGTDSPWRDQAGELESARRAFPDARLRSLVLEQNAARLLDSTG